VLLATQDQTTAWTTQRFMRRRGYVISMRNWRRMQPGSNWTSNVCNISKHARTDTASDLSDAFEIDGARIRRGATDEQFRLMLFRDALQLVVIDLLPLFRNTVVSDFVTKPGKIQRMTVRQMTTVRQVHSQNLIAILDRREIHGHVRLRAAVRL